jgi:hypothetical protein
MRISIRRPPVQLVAASILLAVAMALTGSLQPMALLLVAGAVVLGTMPFWSAGDNRLSLDKVPLTALFVISSPETAYILSLFAVMLAYSLFDFTERRGINASRVALEGIISPSLAFTLAASSLEPGWLRLLLLYFAVYLGDIISQSLSLRLPRTLLRAPSWGASFALSSPFALLVLSSAAGNDPSSVTLLLAAGVAFSTLSKMRMDAQKTYSRLASETAVQNSLAAELSAASSVGQYLGLIEAYLRSGTSGVTILTRQESGQGWIGWMENRQFTVHEDATTSLAVARTQFERVDLQPGSAPAHHAFARRRPGGGVETQVHLPQPNFPFVLAKLIGRLEAIRRGISREDSE